jgi:hypothetical protein
MKRGEMGRITETLDKLARPEGFEPPTLCSVGRCSFR